MAENYLGKISMEQTFNAKENIIKFFTFICKFQIGSIFLHHKSVRGKAII